jgi:UDP-GlcNAc3NAcA epimerase
VTKILSIVGARPQFIKAAAVSRAITKREGLTEVMVHTGQHFDTNMSDIFFDELSIPEPAHTLGINSCGHGAMTGRMLEALEKVMREEQPSVVVVYGDTNTTLAGALAAVKLHIPVAHVEAGLRSFNRVMPEEINRVVVDHVSSFLFCPTSRAVINLQNEGLKEGIYHVGDVMYDACLFAASKARGRSDVFEHLGIAERKYAVATIHREESTASRQALGALIDYLRNEARRLPVLFPVHPRTRQAVKSFGLSFGGLVDVEPVGYLDMVRLVAGAACIYTDSGGLQKEAYFHRIPCVTLRGETEWVETVSSGWNRLWQGPDYVQPRREIEDYGEGTAAEKLVTILAEYVGQKIEHCARVAD